MILLQIEQIFNYDPLENVKSTRVITLHSYPATSALSTRTLSYGQKDTLTLSFLFILSGSVPSVSRKLRLPTAETRYVLRLTFHGSV